MKKIKYVLLAFLACGTVLMSAACGSSVGTASEPESFIVEGLTEALPKVTDVVGTRTVETSREVRHANAEDGDVLISCTYTNVENAFDDVTKYCAKLTSEYGFQNVDKFDGESVSLTAPSIEEGKIINLKIEVNENGYVVTLSSDNSNSIQSTSSAA